MTIARHDRQERVTFYEAQRRNRRSGRRYSALSVVAVALLGLPLSVIISPLIAAVGIVAVDATSHATTVPDPGQRVIDAVERMADSDDPDGPGGPAQARPVSVSGTEAAALAAVMILPGMVVMGLTWLCVRRLFLRSGAGAVALAAGARPPRPDDLEERQLVNLVDEMALAAGVPPLRVLVLDRDVVNAAVVGNRVEDATLIVHRRLLDDLGRGPTEALVGDMLAVVVNGDLRGALVLASVYQTFDVMAAALAFTSSRRARRVLWRACRLSLRPRARRGDGAEERFLAVELTAVTDDAMDDASKGGCVRTVIGFPFFVASIAFVLTRLLVGGFILSPVLAARWRRRRLLADATAVELTRDPDALARGLEHLRDHGGVVPAGPWTHLFAVGPEAARGRSMVRFARRRDEIWSGERRPGESAAGSFARRSREAIAASQEMRRDLAPAETGSDAAGPSEIGQELGSFLPPLATRLDRLAQMGAHLSADPAASVARYRPARGMTALAWVIGVPLVALLAVLFLMLFLCLAAMIGLALLFELALVLPVVYLSHGLLRA